MRRGRTSLARHACCDDAGARLTPRERLEAWRGVVPAGRRPLIEASRYLGREGGLDDGGCLVLDFARFQRRGMLGVCRMKAM